MQLNRKYLIVVVLALVLANVIYFYVKTRPKPPEVVLNQSLSWMMLDGPEGSATLVYLDENNKWRTADDKPANLPQIVELTIPNTDGPYYALHVAQAGSWHFGDVIAVIRSAAKEGICNLIIRDHEMLISDAPRADTPFVPFLTVAKFSRKQGAPMEPCVSDPIIERRYAKAANAYARQREDNNSE